MFRRLFGTDEPDTVRRGMRSRYRDGMPIGRMLVVAILLASAACAPLERMPPTPNLSRDGSGSDRLSELDPSLQTPEIEILYVTDRSKEGVSRRGPRYGYGRALAIAYGTAEVSLDPTPTWEQLVESSGTGARSTEWALDLTQVDEVGEFTLTTRSLEVVDGELRRTAEAQAQLDVALEGLRSLVRSRLERTPHKDVYLYVHGFNNTFYDAIARAAILWQAISRQGVFIAYTWPAGSGGLRGYFYYRESGEFTSFHLRELIRFLAAMPEVERLHIVAHSRGTDVAVTALRELNIALRTQDLDPQVALKLETLMLAAPDLDLDIFTRRFWLENLGLIARRSVIYFSREDGAIDFSNWLFRSRSRVGTLSQIQFSPEASELVKQLPHLQMIECQVSGHGTSHAYVFGHPAAMSDVVAVLRDRRDAGAAHGRPLEARGDGTWLLTNDYFAEVRETRSPPSEGAPEPRGSAKDSDTP